MAAAKKNPSLSGFLTGLLVGLALALAVAFLITRNNPFVDNAAPEPGRAPAQRSAPDDAPRYEFNEPSGAEPILPALPESAGHFLQAGAFTNAADADQLKAQLALLGFEARVVYSAHAETPLHRVHIGPYRAMDEPNRARTRLTQGGIETLLIKATPPTTTQTQENP